MTTLAQQLNGMSHDEVRAWLESALRGREALPKLTPDEPWHLAVLRLDKQVGAAVRDSFRNGSLELLQRFCEHGDGDEKYVGEVLGLAARFDDDRATHMLAALAQDFDKAPHPKEQHQAVLSSLVDMSPPQTAEFWQALLGQDPGAFAGYALSGVLATEPERGVTLLALLPNTEEEGEGAALKLELSWDTLGAHERPQFEARVRDVLGACGQHVAGPVRAWLERQSSTANADDPLRAALAKCLGEGVAPRVYSPKLVPPLKQVA